MAMEEMFSMSYNQAYPRVPRVPRVPRGWTSSEFNSRLGFGYSNIGENKRIS
jgi:hypothetical protein